MATKTITPKITFPVNLKEKYFLLTNLLSVYPAVACKQTLTRSDLTVHVLHLSTVQASAKKSSHEEKVSLLHNLFGFLYSKNNKYVFSVFIKPCYLLGKGTGKTRNIFVSDEISADTNCWHISSLLGGK